MKADGGFLLKQQQAPAERRLSSVASWLQENAEKWSGRLDSNQRPPAPKADFNQLLKLVAGARPQWVANERLPPPFCDL